MAHTVGIDFGTTKSLIAYLKAENQVEWIHDPSRPDAQGFLPSLPGKVPSQMVADATGFEDTGPSPDEITSLFTRFHGLVENEFGAKEELKAVIGAAQHLSPKRRQILEDGVLRAGWREVIFLSEPLAAALAYAWFRKQRGMVVVYDLGGRQFQAAAIDIRQGSLELLGEVGTSDFGGDHMDWKIVDRVMQELSAQGFQDWAHDEGVLAQIKNEVALARRAVSHRGSYDIKLSEPVKFQYALSRFEIAGLSREVVESTIPLCEKILSEAGLETGDVQAVILTGGASRMPLVHECTGKFFKQEPVFDINPDQAVAQGLAVAAAMQSGIVPPWKF